MDFLYGFDLTQFQQYDERTPPFRTTICQELWVLTPTPLIETVPLLN
jgi:hypothetical protein